LADLRISARADCSCSCACFLHADHASPVWSSQRSLATSYSASAFMSTTTRAVGALLHAAPRRHRRREAIDTTTLNISSRHDAARTCPRGVLAPPGVSRAAPVVTASVS
jgi:hypothetical protein